MAEGDDVGWDSAMSEHRQRHPDGNAELLAQLKRHFRLGCALERSRTCADVVRSGILWGEPCQCIRLRWRCFRRAASKVARE